MTVTSSSLSLTPPNELVWYPSYLRTPTVSRCGMHQAMGLEGNMKDGPWSYRILSLLIVSPIYSVVLITLGTLSGRHLFFANMGGKILKRFVPKKVGERIICPPAAASNTVTTAAKAAKKG